jgi:ABC-type spermidine/putrescine transport system permease subunit II
MARDADPGASATLRSIHGEHGRSRCRRSCSRATSSRAARPRIASRAAGWQAAAASLTEGVLATCVSLWAIGYFRHHHNRLRPLARRMAPAAYGAFLVDPPVIIGLALAIHRPPVPAELKFLCVLTGGVAGSFGLAALAARARPIARITGAGPRAAPEAPSAVRSR